MLCVSITVIRCLFLIVFISTVLCQNACKKVNTWFIIVNGLRRSHDQQIKGKSKVETHSAFTLNVKRRFEVEPVFFL